MKSSWLGASIYCTQLSVSLRKCLILLPYLHTSTSSDNITPSHHHRTTSSCLPPETEEGWASIRGETWSCSYLASTKLICTSLHTCANYIEGLRVRVDSKSCSYCSEQAELWKITINLPQLYESLSFLPGRPFPLLHTKYSNCGFLLVSYACCKISAICCVFVSCRW